MAEANELKVVLAQEAKADLAQIWRWNAANYSVAHADGYVEFLFHEVQKLGIRRTLAKPLRSRPGYSYINIRRSRQGYGHIAVFRVRLVATVLFVVLQGGASMGNC